VADEEEQVTRAREPEDDQVLGIVLRKEGGGKYRVYCSDGNKRICRIPGSRKRAVYIERDTVVLVDPWKIEGDEKGDIVESYTQAETDWLRGQGYLEEVDEFL
jgi:translation initiation factor 1A